MNLFNLIKGTYKKTPAANIVLHGSGLSDFPLRWGKKPRHPLSCPFNVVLDFLGRAMKQNRNKQTKKKVYKLERKK